MLNIATWILGATVLAGLGLSAFYLTEKPIRGAVRWASAAHGLSGAAGFVLAVLAASHALDRQGFGRIAIGFLAATLLGGLVIAAAQLRRRRPPGLVVALHAITGVAGLVILAAYASVG